MAGGIFSRLKIWNAGETVKAADLNAEFNNTIANIDAVHSSGYSSNLAEMRATENPGSVGSENLIQPISIAQEIMRIRYTISRLMGTAYWYSSPAATLASLNTSISDAFFIAPSRIISGMTSALSSQPKFLVASGAGGVTLDATPTAFNAYIDNALYTFTTDITLTGLSASIGVGNTATLADNFTDAQLSRTVKEFNISGAGSEFSANVGRTGIFKIFNGTSTEYFMGTVESTSKLSGLYRGYLFDSSGVPSTPVTLTTGHTITILRMTYIFLNAGGYLEATYNPLIYGSTTPLSASIGDFWFDETVDMWKKFNGSLWVQANSIFVGVCAQDGSSTVVSRSNDFYKQFNQTNDVFLASTTNSTVTSRARSKGNISVYGSNLNWQEFRFVFDITSMLVSGETEQASTTYWLYISEIGRPYLSSLAPIARPELKGYYHPYETWRAVGSVFNNVSSNFVETPFSYNDRTQPSGWRNNINVTKDATSGPLTVNLPSAVGFNDGEITYTKTDSSTNLVTITDGTFTTKMWGINQIVSVRSNGAAWFVSSRSNTTTASFAVSGVSSTSFTGGTAFNYNGLVLKDNLGGLSNGAYTVKVAGTWEFNGGLYATASGVFAVNLYKNGALAFGSGRSVIFYIDSVTGGRGKRQLDCAVGDVITLVPNGTSSLQLTTDGAMFEGVLLT
jgi:hypothetical protein